MLLPWLQLARRRTPDAVAHYFDCASCKKTQPVVVRQSLGCGYLPKLPPNVPVIPWDHVGREISSSERDERGRLRLPVCPGYACSLPEVIETSWAHSYWEKGELAQWCEGQATPALRDAVGVYAIESANAAAWESRNPEKR